MTPGSRPHSAIRARDARAADLQEEPTQRIASRADSFATVFRRIRRSGGSSSEHRRERSEPSDAASAATNDRTRTASGARTRLFVRMTTKSGCTARSARASERSQRERSEQSNVALSAISRRLLGEDTGSRVRWNEQP